MDLTGLVGNFVFLGNAGTGKTTVARKMGQILHKFGILARPDVIVTAGEELTGQYLGQTKKVVEEKMESARGGVLLIDEAYAMGKGEFGKEAMTTLVKMLTEPEYMGGKTVVVLAGYSK